MSAYAASIDSGVREMPWASRRNPFMTALARGKDPCAVRPFSGAKMEQRSQQLVAALVVVTLEKQVVEVTGHVGVERRT